MKKVNIFLSITFVATWSIAFWLMGNGGYQNPLAQIVLMVGMIIPAISAILTSFITKENIKDLWIKPNFKNNKKSLLSKIKSKKDTMIRLIKINVKIIKITFDSTS